MKKTITITLSLMLTAFLAVNTGCGNKTTGPASSSGVSLYEMVPADASGVFTLNIKKLSSLSVFDKMQKDIANDDFTGKDKFFKNYEDFVDKTGIDPKKDLYSVVIAVFGDMKAKSPEFSIIANLKYDKTKILSILKEKVKPLTEESYLGSTIYKFKDEKEKDIAMSFIAPDLISAGTPVALKKTLDLSKGKIKSLETNKKIMGFLKRIKGDPILSFVFPIPPELRAVKGSGMFRMDLSKAEAVIGHANYSGTDWTGNIILISQNEDGNKKMKTSLDGLKGFGAMAGPEFAELVNSINISASPENLTISISISNELLEKLKKKAKKKIGNMKDESVPSFNR